MSSDEDEPPVADPPSPSIAGSEASSAPPPPAGQSLSADQLSSHPVWMAARGSNANGTSRPVQVPAAARGRGGRGRGAGSRTPSEAGDGSGGPRFERISLAELEAQQYADGDGADSVLNSDEEAEADEFSRIRNAPEPHGGSRRRKRSRGGPRKEGPGEHDEGESGEESESGDDSDGGGDERRRKLEGMLGAAAFGGASGAWKQAGSDAGSAPSEQSSTRRRNAYRDAFPVRGVNCVGCALNNRIGPVNRFVRDNISQMTEDALWKMAALTYKREVAEPAEREGAVVPKWGWKEVRVHYELHSTSNLVARHKMLRQLQSMRSQQEQRLVRVDGTEKELDRQGADMMLKIMQAESRERQLLEQSINGKKRD